MFLCLKWGRPATFEKRLYLDLNCGISFTIWKITSQCYNSLDVCSTVKIPCYCIHPDGRGKKMMLLLWLFSSVLVSVLYKCCLSLCFNFVRKMEKIPASSLVFSALLEKLEIEKTFENNHADNIFFSSHIHLVLTVSKISTCLIQTTIRMLLREPVELFSLIALLHIGCPTLWHSV